MRACGEVPLLLLRNRSKLFGAAAIKKHSAISGVKQNRRCFVNIDGVKSWTDEVVPFIA